MYFPTDENKVVEFLEKFAGIGLQEVYLSLVSEKIMTTLRKKCPNLETLSFLKAKTPETDNYTYDSQTLEDKLYIPPRLRRLEMFASPLPPLVSPLRSGVILGTDYHKIRVNREEKIFFLLSQCPNLRYISLQGFEISEAGLQKLIENVNIKELDLIKPYPWPSRRRSMVLDDVLTAAAAFMNSLQRLRLDSYVRHKHVLEKFPGCISLWKNLKVLALRGVGCSDESFEMMIPGLLNLDSLELEGSIVTSNIISMIGKNLKKITFLKLGNGHYSDESLESLADHPFLERLWIYKEYTIQWELPLISNWLHAIYGVLVTLPEIKRVTMEGFRLIFLHTQESFPVIKSAEIEIINTSKYVPEGLQ